VIIIINIFTLPYRKVDCHTLINKQEGRSVYNVNSNERWVTLQHLPPQNINTQSLMSHQLTDTSLQYHNIN